MNRGKEKIPGYIRFPRWRWLVIMPKDVFEEVKKYLKFLEKSDEEMHEELTEKEILDGLYDDGIIVKKPKIRVNI